MAHSPEQGLDRAYPFHLCRRKVEAGVATGRYQFGAAAPPRLKWSALTLSLTRSIWTSCCSACSDGAAEEGGAGGADVRRRASAQPRIVVDRDVRVPTTLRALHARLHADPLSDLPEAAELFVLRRARAGPGPAPRWSRTLIAGLPSHRRGASPAPSPSRLTPAAPPRSSPITATSTGLTPVAGVPVRPTRPPAWLRGRHRRSGRQARTTPAAGRGAATITAPRSRPHSQHLRIRLPH